MERLRGVYGGRLWTQVVLHVGIGPVSKWLFQVRCRVVEVLRCTQSNCWKICQAWCTKCGEKRCRVHYLWLEYWYEWCVNHNLLWRKTESDYRKTFFLWEFIVFCLYQIIVISICLIIMLKYYLAYERNIIRHLK
jgi:hypothetical protein